MGHAEYRSFLYIRVCLQKVLNFNRINVFCVTQYQVACAGIDVEKLILKVTDIAGAQPAPRGGPR